MDRLETALHLWVAFGIMPLFALANAGVTVDLAALGSPVALAVAVGPVVGKPLGTAGKIGTLTGSTLSAALGMVLLLCFLGPKQPESAGEEGTAQLQASQSRPLTG